MQASCPGSPPARDTHRGKGRTQNTHAIECQAWEPLSLMNEHGVRAAPGVARGAQSWLLAAGGVGGGSASGVDGRH